VPDVKNYKHFYQWIKELPEVESPCWSGLPMNVEKLVRERQTRKLISNMKVLQGTGDDLVTVGEEAKAEKDNEAAWLVKLQFKLVKMSKVLPLQLQMLQRTS
jgi:hypothetical protein